MDRAKVQMGNLVNANLHRSSSGYITCSMVKISKHLFESVWTIVSTVRGTASTFGTPIRDDTNRDLLIPQFNSYVNVTAF